MMLEPEVFRHTPLPAVRHVEAAFSDSIAMRGHGIFLIFVTQIIYLHDYQRALLNPFCNKNAITVTWPDTFLVHSQEFL